ncbi:MAG: hypothetical protein WCH84_06380 [Verrucomicrobiota bacterium]
MNQQTIIFPVNNRAYSISGSNLEYDNLAFVKGINGEFFSYLGDTHGDKTEDSEVGGRAAMALRLAYHHGVEALLALLAGTLQAPNAIVAWLPLCNTQDLREIVAAINRKDTALLHLLKMSEVSWHGLARIINQFQVPEGTPEHVAAFGDVWQHLAKQFLYDGNQSEYNAIKHGFRASAGGFMNMKFKATDGTEHHFEGSKFGSRFFVPVDVPRAPKGNLRLKRCAINWKPEGLVDSLHMIAMSINNVHMFLRHINGDKSELRMMFPTLKNPGSILGFVADGPDVIGFDYVEDITPSSIFPTQPKMLEQIQETIARDKQHNAPVVPVLPA